MRNSEASLLNGVAKYRYAVLVLVLVSALSCGIAVIHLALLQIAVFQRMSCVFLLYFLIVPFLNALLILGCADFRGNSSLSLYTSIRKSIAVYGNLVVVFMIRVVITAMPVVLLYLYLQYLASVPEYNIAAQNADTIAEENSIIAIMSFLFVYPLFVGFVVSRFFLVEPTIVLGRNTIVRAIWKSFMSASNILGLIFAGILLVITCMFLASLSAMRYSEFSFLFMKDVRFVFGLHIICSFLIIANGVLKANMYFNVINGDQSPSSSKGNSWGWLL